MRARQPFPGFRVQHEDETSALPSIARDGICVATGEPPDRPQDLIRCPRWAEPGHQLPGWCQAAAHRSVHEWRTDPGGKRSDPGIRVREVPSEIEAQLFMKATRNAKCRSLPE